MAKQLLTVVDYVRKHSCSTVAVDLARLNLLVGRAISRNAEKLPDDPDLVERAWRCARNIVGEHEEATL